MIIGITGQSGAGKDTVADHLVKKHGFWKVAFADPMKRYCKEVYDFSDEQLWGNSNLRNEPDWRYPRSSRAIGDPEKVRRELEDVRPSAHEKTWLQMAAGHFLTPRYALQTLGTEWGRNCWEDTWATYTMRIASELLDPSKHLGYLAPQGVFHALDPKDTWPRPRGIVIPDMRFFNELRVVQKAKGVTWRVQRPGYEGQVGITGHASEEEQKLIFDTDLDVIITNDTTLDELFAKIDEVMFNPHTWMTA